ncbi:hypothetical protein [Cupriavidus sp. SW-Y-13]|uniref:hypothetical protein n=1 Tax=Cupriavidus sp. SW-Y-13 TaxID=2653854 RepID=UPI0013659AF9|nr:hypothetical protein [Cupriavidus sp. SW-Y-13]MWL91411.1 hypothetical protein [Cupriavidus sp. SW-Y-13]
MPLFNVDIVYRAVIQADTPQAACVVAVQERLNIEGDSMEPRIELAGRVRAPSDLEDGWTEADTPYGGDGAASIRQLLLADAAPERDPLTMDMFEEQA